MSRPRRGSAGKVLQLVTSADRRGAEVFATELGQGLAQLDVPVSTVALSPATTVEQLDVDVLGERARSPKTAVHLRRRARGVPIVIAHGSATLPAAALGLWGTSVPFAYRSIGDIACWASDPARAARVGLFLRRAAFVVALWDKAANDIVHRFGVPRERVHVIPNGVLPERFAAADERQRRQCRVALGLPHDAPVAAYVGSLTPEKDVSTAIQAVASLPRMCLAIAGDGPERQRLQALACAWAPGRVQFLGAVQDVSPVLAGADVFVLTSLTEGQPAAPIEAGMAGLPVVATDVGGVRSVVADGETGRLVPPRDPRAVADALEVVLGAAEEMGSAARQRTLESFSLHDVTRRWRELVSGYL